MLKRKLPKYSTAGTPPQPWKPGPGLTKFHEKSGDLAAASMVGGNYIAGMDMADGQMTQGGAFMSNAMNLGGMGMTIGSAFGPVGSAVGAGIGFLGGGIYGLLSHKKQQEQQRINELDLETARKNALLQNHATWSSDYMKQFGTTGLVRTGYYKYGGPVKKKDEQALNRPVYEGPAEYACSKEGCSKIVSTELHEQFRNASYNDLGPEDAWYRKASVLNTGGDLIWESSDFSNDSWDNYSFDSLPYDQLQYGDIVSLWRGTNTKRGKESLSGYEKDQNEGNEHVGYVIGFNEEGVPMIRHGSESGKGRVDPITDVKLDGVTGQLKYKPTSVYRTKGIRDYNLQPDQKFEQPFKQTDVELKDQPIGGAPYSTTWFGNKAVKRNQERFVKMMNEQQDEIAALTGLSGQELASLGELALGIFGQESSFDAPKSKAKRLVKQTGKEALNNTGAVGDFVYEKIDKPKNSASLGPTRMKFDDISN